jgi:hypothetical protein
MFGFGLRGVQGNEIVEKGALNFAKFEVETIVYCDASPPWRGRGCFR